MARSTMDRRPVGRPRGDCEVSKTLRLSVTEADALRALAGRWGCSESAAVRRAIVAVATAEGLSGPDGSKPTIYPDGPGRASPGG